MTPPLLMYLGIAQVYREFWRLTRMRGTAGRASRGKVRGAVLALSCVTAAVLALPATAAATLPVIATGVVTSPLANFGSHRGVTVSAQCGAGARLVGGGGYLRNATDPLILPTNGLVLGGSTASTGAAPVDLAAADGATDPASWMSIANFTGVSEAGDQASTFALCATSAGPSHTVVKAAGRVGANATQEVSPPNLATATCPAATRLVGGGATTSTPDQVNDGATVGNNGNLKPMGDYPSDAAGVAAADGATDATSWSAFGSAGITGLTDTVTAYALCSTDAATPVVRVKRIDLDGPDAQPGTSVTTASATCPATSRMLGGGYRVLESVAGVGGLQPQQGYHMRGSYPSTTGATPPAAVADATANPDTWTDMAQAGGQGLAAGKHMTTSSFAMCLTEPAAPAVQTGDPTSVGGSSATLEGSVTPNNASTGAVVEFGTTLSFGFITSTASIGSGDASVALTATLSGLQAGTTYFYRVVATNAAGTTFGTVKSFTTTGTTAPVANTLDAVAVSATTATLAGQVNPKGQATAFTFEYGTTTSFGSISAVDNAGAGGSLQNVTLPIAGLLPGTTYLYRLVATNASGTTAGAVHSFTTPAAS
jgi:hypothetical protein